MRPTRLASFAGSTGFTRCPSKPAALARAVNDVEQVVRASYPQMNPSARAGVQQSLAALDRAIAQAPQRERAAPDDPRAARYLTGALRKKLQVLRTVQNLTQRS